MESENEIILNDSTDMELDEDENIRSTEQFFKDVEDWIKCVW